MLSIHRNRTFLQYFIRNFVHRFPSGEATGDVGFESRLVFAAAHMRIPEELKAVSSAGPKYTKFTHILTLNLYNFHGQCQSPHFG